MPVTQEVLKISLYDFTFWFSGSNGKKTMWFTLQPVEFITIPRD